ncbi:MAG: sulfite exporter TauE/SafE family protein [Thiovulaceae bacterium]|nr:sulfite exporter TauE/SafE family protein [Sulfurimonadaceae bacterium]MCW9025760.1 sulfite exporter TauE/SafE family protein [Sulfurimonadaceae bacterium]
MLALVVLGAIVGSLSGFFGIGGGTILVPLLLALGYKTKVAIGIAVVQMVFSSIYGSYLNKKNGSLDFSIVLYIAIGGFIGAMLSGGLASYFSDTTLELIFLFFATFALIRLFFRVEEHKEQRSLNKFLLLFIGLSIGSLSMTIGVGGSILIVPILVGFLHVDLKRAISAGLFFVIFSSVAGFISHYISGHIDLKTGLIVGISSLFGVYIGIYLKQRVKHNLQRKLIIIFYISVVSYLTYRVFG